MNRLQSIKKIFKASAALVVLVLMIGFAQRRQGSRPIADINIKMDQPMDHHFLTQEEVLRLINNNQKDYLLNNDLKHINLKELEKRVEAHPFVKSAQAYVDVKGNLSIAVSEHRPIARVLNPRGADYYIGAEGNILPQSKHYTANVLLIDMKKKPPWGKTNIRHSPKGEAIYQLLMLMDADAFWRAQIAGMTVEPNQEIRLIPQVTKQIVTFGQPQDIQEKLRKLMIFYKKILPYKGWNAYSSVNLKYKNQIVCRR